MLPSGPTLPGHVLVVGVDGVRFDFLEADSAPSLRALGQAGFLAPVPSGPAENWTIVVVTDHGHLDEGGHGGREPEVVTAWAAAAGPGIRPGAAPPITRQDEVAPLVLAAAGCPAHPG